MGKYEDKSAGYQLQKDEILDTSAKRERERTAEVLPENKALTYTLCTVLIYDSLRSCRDAGRIIWLTAASSGSNKVGSH